MCGPGAMWLGERKLENVAEGREEERGWERGDSEVGRWDEQPVL